jgi:hypothetical protein
MFWARQKYPESVLELMHFYGKNAESILAGRAYKEIKHSKRKIVYLGDKTCYPLLLDET